MQNNDKSMKSVQPINAFRFRFNNPELENKVYHFFNYNGLLPLFKEDSRAIGTIVVSDAEARELTNNRVNKKQRVLKEFADFYLQLGDGNKSFNEAMFKIIYESNSLTGLVNNIAKYMAYIKGKIKIDQLYNTWNIVFYNKELK